MAKNGLWNTTGKIEWYLPVSQVADMLNCHWRRVYELIQQGALDVIVFGSGKTRISRASVRRYMDSRP
ncbi:MAG: helix-turn-helix domain-containing protein [Acidobacteriota bacterium]